jgi:diguanylate cyclase (GGDEF)-like protein
VTEHTQPNPYLDDPLRDVETTDGMKLTKVNPAFMTRQIAEIANESNGVRVHITSLDPIRPANAATQREAKALRQFQEGTEEVGTVVREGGKREFFFMAPLLTDASCLKCHAEQGYKEGDIRGGISISMPLPHLASPASLGVGYIVIGGLGLLCIVWFGTRLSEAYETLRYQSSRDALTGLPNRRALLERVSTEMGRSRRRKGSLAIIIGDIDRFKCYNDTFGHPAGDGCLRWVAQAIQSVLRRPGDFCARYGGEEFAVVLPDVDEEGALHVAERIRNAVETLAIPHAKSGGFQVVTISLGVAVSLDGQGEFEKLFQRADLALYAAKDGGRNQVRAFSPDMEDAQREIDENALQAT